MQIAGFNEMSLSDYPKKVSCVIFTAGCHFNCEYCQNWDMIKKGSHCEWASVDDVLSLIEVYKTRIDAIVVSGGEPLIHEDLEFFLAKIKALFPEFPLKLDTTGLPYFSLRRIIRSKLVDYVALDFKTSTFFKRWNVYLDALLWGISYLREKGIPYELRTTVHPSVVSIEELEQMAKYVPEGVDWYIQRYHNSPYVKNKDLNDGPFYTEEDILAFIKRVGKGTLRR